MGGAERGAVPVPVPVPESSNQGNFLRFFFQIH